MNDKKCCVCHETKSIENFGKLSRAKDGLRSQCRSCRAIEKQLYMETHKEKIKESNKIYAETHQEELKAYKKLWLEKNPDFVKTYRETHKEEIKLLTKRYREEHKEELRNNRRGYDARRSLIDPYFKMYKLVKCRLAYAFRQQSKFGKTKSCSEYGIDFQAIFDKLGPRPGKEYHMDHIIPVSVFDFDISEHVRLATSPENLRWLVGGENLEKRASLIDEIYENPELVNILYIIKDSGKFSENEIDKICKAYEALHK
jgi:hypothetical protein